MGCPLIAASDLQFLEELGRGGFGVVWRAMWVSHIQEVAVIQLHAQSLSAAALKEFRDEAEIVRKLVSPFLLTLQGICIAPTRACSRCFTAAHLSHGRCAFAWRARLREA